MKENPGSDHSSEEKEYFIFIEPKVVLLFPKT